MSERAWKVAERKLARDMGSQRIPVTGERHGADFSDSLALYQAKVRNTIPGWLWTWLAGIVGRASTDTSGRIGVLVLNRPRRPRREALVVLRWADWVALHGTPSSAEDAHIPDLDQAPINSGVE